MIVGRTQQEQGLIRHRQQGAKLCSPKAVQKGQEHTAGWKSGTILLPQEKSCKRPQAGTCGECSAQQNTSVELSKKQSIWNRGIAHGPSAGQTTVSQEHRAAAGATHLSRHRTDITMRGGGSTCRSASQGQGQVGTCPLLALRPGNFLCITWQHMHGTHAGKQPHRAAGD